MAWTLYSSVAKGSKLKARKFGGLIPTLVEVAGVKMVWGDFRAPPIPNRVKVRDKFIKTNRVATADALFRKCFST